MRRLLWSGLCLALGLLAAEARAQDDTWRSGQATGAGAAPGRGLMRPVPLDSGPAARENVTPVSFTPADQPRPLVRAKPFEQKAPQPMPPGPPLATGLTGVHGKGNGNGGELKKMPPNGGPKAEPIAPPKGAEVWGNIVSRWTEGEPVILNGGEVPLGGDDCGAPCGDGDCAAGHTRCGPLRARLGLLMHRLFGRDDCCGSDCGGCDQSGGLMCEDPCARRGCLYGRAEYLLWWVKGYDVPPLVTASAPGTAREAAGVLGQPTTSVLFGGNPIEYDGGSGGRFTFGFCLPNCPDWSIESTYFFLGGRSVGFLAGSNGSPILARPIVNAVTGNEEAQLVAFPDVVVGSVAVRSETKLWGIEGNLRKHLCGGCNGHLDFLIGFRYLDLRESLNIAEDLTALSAQDRATAGARIIVSDSFNTRNQFYGGQIGFEGEYRLGRKWFLGGSAKVGLGVMRQVVSIDGGTAFLVPGAGASLERGGILALPTNIGEFRSSQFAVVPEVGVRLGYNLTDNLRLFVGYNFLYASSVVRPGDQIDRGINKTQIPTAFGPSALQGTPRPTVMFRSTDFWAQGVNVGLEFKY